MNSTFSDICSYAINGGILLVGTIPALERLESVADAYDLMAVESFSASSRRAERLAWRMMLRCWAQQNSSWAGDYIEIEYSEQGAPRILNFIYEYISVSHCRDRVAIALSDTPCAVDIECLDRNFHNLAPRYLSDEEQGMAADTATQAAMWSAKECLYKLYGADGLNLRNDICINEIDPSTNTILGEISQLGKVTMHYKTLDAEHIIVYHI